MRYRINLQLFASSKSTTTSKSEGGSHESSFSSTVGGSNTHTEGGSTSESHSYGESHAQGGSVSTSGGKTWASGEVEANTANKRNEYNRDYEQGDNVTATYDRLQATLDKKPAFQSKYEDKLNELYDQILNRDKFSYDFNADSMYQLYKDQYTQQGKKAMQDTMAQQAALTGGYGSSYAQTAGQQTYQNYLNQLNNMIPTLRNQAYNEYEREGQDLLNKYNITSDAYNREYGNYRDDVADWQADRSFNYGMYSDERNFDYNQFAQDRNYWNQEYWNERNSAQSNAQQAQENNWNDTYSKQDTYTNTKYWEDSSSNYWSNTASESTATNWANNMSSTLSSSGGGSGAQAAAQQRYQDMLKEAANKQATVNNNTGKYALDWQYQAPAEAQNGVSMNGAWNNLSTADKNTLTSEVQKAAQQGEEALDKKIAEILDGLQYTPNDPQYESVVKALLARVDNMNRW